MTPDLLARTVQSFLQEATGAVVLEDGAVAFDLGSAKYSISGEHNRCLLHLWSAERNAVRRVVDAEVKSGTLRLAVQRMGQSRPTKLEICRNRDRRTPSAKRAARAAYEQKLRRVLERKFPGFAIARLTTGADLEKSFGPIYARGLLRHGQTAYAVLGVNEKETQASVDAALTFAILWLDECRQAQAGRALVEGLKLFAPAGRSALLQERMAGLNRAAAKWRLFEFDERHDAVTEIDCKDRGNVATRLVHAADEEAAHGRFAESIAKISQWLPGCEVAVLSAAELSFRWRGLEFARARLGTDFSQFTEHRFAGNGSSENLASESLPSECLPSENRSAEKSELSHAPTSYTREEIVFGVGAEERVLGPRSEDPRNEAVFHELIAALREARHPYGPKQSALWRMHPERWLESLVAADVSVIDERLAAESHYSQLPAFSASDRAMIDVLTRTREGRLAVVELKADEDIHLPLQGLDYWSRVAWHHARGEFTRFGYFGGRELSNEPPLLFLVSPALHVHPATDTLLRYLSPGIEWELVGIDERWREAVKVVFRKRADRGIRRGADAVMPVAS